jgi:osmoprotectant transport system permease protein
MRYFLLAFILYFSNDALSQTIRVGSKHFTEGYITSEIVSQLLESKGFQVERKFNLGGTMVCFSALQQNEIDVYPEYTGTLSYEILKAGKALDISAIKQQLNKSYGLDISSPYGFNNAYALIVKKAFAQKHQLKSISDLKNVADLNLGLSYEFLKRQDGWENLASAYELKQKPVGLEHGLAYQALDDNKIDVTDAYATDGEIKRYDLVVLADDRNFFPDYRAVSFYGLDLNVNAKALLEKLRDVISESEMQEMNAAVLYKKKSYATVASEFLLSKGLVVKNKAIEVSSTLDLVEKILVHLKLTLLSLLFAIIIAVPLGILIHWYPSVSKTVLYISGLMQTIPSIALLAILIPFTGIGIFPAIIALFLYALLPILRNTVTGLQAVDPVLKKVADGMGMDRFQKLRFLEFPLSLTTILAGIRTAAVINIGTATLAAFIGAGGLGEYIVTGLALNNSSMILRGAIPAALLAIVVELCFEIVEFYLSARYRKAKKKLI